MFSPASLFRFVPLLALPALVLTACAPEAGEGPAVQVAAGPSRSAPGVAAPSRKPETALSLKAEVLKTPPEAGAAGCYSHQTYVKNNGKDTGSKGEFWFQSPCSADLTKDFTASLQRALAARGLYRGPVTGLSDAATKEAVLRYQSSRGLPSGELSFRAAQEMGLIVWNDGH